MSIFRKRAAYKKQLSSFSCKTIVYVQLTGLLHQKLYISESSKCCSDDESRAKGLFAWAMQVVWGLSTILIYLLWEKEPVKVSVGWGNLEQMLYQGDIETHLFYQKQQKMRKAITHFLETGSVTVLRYQSKLQDNANKSEGLSCNFKTYSSDQVGLAVLIIWLKDLLHWHWCNCPPWLNRAVPVPISSSAASKCLHLHPPLPEERFKFKSAISVKTIKMEALQQLKMLGKLYLDVMRADKWSLWLPDCLANVETTAQFLLHLNMTILASARITNFQGQSINLLRRLHHVPDATLF